MSKPVSVFLDDIETELKHRLDGMIKPDARAYPMWKRAVEIIPGQTARQIHLEAYQFAKNIKYQHGGLPPEIYFCHPLRVGAMAIYVSGVTDQDAGIVGILHNVLEVSGVSVADLQRQFGQSVADQIATLTVDRKQEWDIAYKISYYKKINQGPRSARIVKILDKLDNIFLINKNPDLQVRSQYLEEIEKHVLPMARRELPDIAEYMDHVIAYNHDREPN